MPTKTEAIYLTVDFSTGQISAAYQSEDEALLACANTPSSLRVVAIEAEEVSRVRAKDG